MGKKVLILSIVLAVLLLGGGLFSAYAMFDAFKSPKTIYLEAEYKAMRQLGESLSKTADLWNSEYLPYLEEPYDSLTEISDFRLSGDWLADDGKTEELLEYMRGWKLAVNAKRDPENNRYLSEMSLNVDGERFIGFEMAVEETRIGIRVKDILDKYIVQELQSETEDGTPNRIVSTREFADFFRIPDEELKPILAEYARIYVEELKDSQFVLNRDAWFRQGNFEKKVRELTLTFNNDELVNLLDKWLDHMEEDDALIDLLYGKIEELAELAEATGGSADDMSRSEFRDNFVDSIKDFRDELKDSDEFSDSLKIVLLIDGKDRILARDITVKSDDGRLDVEWARWIDADDREHVELALQTEGGTDNVDFKAGYSWQPKTGEGSFRVEGYSLIEDDIRSGADISVDFSYAEQDGREEWEVDFAVKVRGMSDSQLKELVGGSIASEGEKDKEERTRDHTSKVSLTIRDDNGEKTNLSFKMRTKETIGREIRFPSYNDANSIIISGGFPEMDPQLMEEIVQSLVRFMEEKADVLEKLGEIFGIPVPDPQELLFGLNPGALPFDPSGDWMDGAYDEEWLDSLYGEWPEGTFDEEWLDSLYGDWPEGSFDEEWLNELYGDWSDGAFDEQWPDGSFEDWPDEIYSDEWWNEWFGESLEFR